MRAAVVLLSVLLPTSAFAATLRLIGTLDGPVVHVRDLWDGAGEAGARVLGPAPLPGGSITVGAAQLGAIARAYGVDWQPQSDGDQAVLSRPGQPLLLRAVLDAVRPALIEQGADSHGAGFEIELPLFQPPMLDAGTTPRLHLEQISLDTVSGRFAAILLVDTGDPAPLRLRLAGSIVAAVSVVVATHPLAAGTLVSPGDVKMQRVRASATGAEIIQDPAQAIGLELRRPMPQGQPLALSDLQRPVEVARHDRVMVALALPGLAVGAIGEALEGGAVGDRITVRNTVSGAVLTAEVTGHDAVRVDPDAPPAMPFGQPGLAFAAR